MIDFGIVDDAESAYALLPKLKAADLDLAFCDMLTYATSATFGVLVRGLDVPLVMVATAAKAMDYPKASTYIQPATTTSARCRSCRRRRARIGRPIPPVILGTLHGDPEAEAELAEW